jgi:hypothetical protein
VCLFQSVFLISNFVLSEYRNQRFSHRAGPVLFTFGPPSPEFYRPSYPDDSQDRQVENAARQQKEKEEYERRKRELGPCSGFLYGHYYLIRLLELEVEREEREAKERAMKQKADVDRLVGAQERAFQVLVSALVRWPLVLILEAGRTFWTVRRGRKACQRVQSRCYRPKTFESRPGPKKAG